MKSKIYLVITIILLALTTLLISSKYYSTNTYQDPSGLFSFRYPRDWYYESFSGFPTDNIQKKFNK